jgi:methylated-DNA-[protein]-cysteine S-methyltransferase
MESLMIYYTQHSSPVGMLVLVATDRGLSGVYFEQHKYFKGTQDWAQAPAHVHLSEAARQLDDYFAGRRTSFDVPLDMAGTPFQQAVWRELAALPFGRTTSYAAIAQRVANARAVRAIGTAIGRNPVSIIVPCHRVLSSAGELSGYAGGLERKRYLLTLEGVPTAVQPELELL